MKLENIAVLFFSYNVNKYFKATDEQKKEEPKDIISTLFLPEWIRKLYRNIEGKSTSFALIGYGIVSLFAYYVKMYKFLISYHLGSIFTFIIAFICYTLVDHNIIVPYQREQSPQNINAFILGRTLLKASALFPSVFGFIILLVFALDNLTSGSWPSHLFSLLCAAVPTILFAVSFYLTCFYAVENIKRKEREKAKKKFKVIR